MPSILLSDNGVSSGSAGLKSVAASDGSLALQTTTAGGTATTAVTIDTSQNVGVGTTPSDRFDVQFATGSGRVKMGVVSGNNVKVYNTAGDISLLSSDSSSDVILDSQRSVTLKATNTTVATVKKDYSLALQGGTSSAGVGITFPATQSASSDANTLDDYEEGEFTPTIGGISTAGTGTYSGQKGKYTKIGNRCLFQIWLDWTNISGAGGSMVVRGLPFTSSGGTYVYNNIASYMDRSIVLSANSVFQSYVIPGDTKIYLAQYAAGGGNAAGVTLDSDGAIMLTGSYEVA